MQDVCGLTNAIFMIPQTTSAYLQDHSISGLAAISSYSHEHAANYMI